MTHSNETASHPEEHVVILYSAASVPQGQYRQHYIPTVERNTQGQYRDSEITVLMQFQRDTTSILHKLLNLMEKMQSRQDSFEQLICQKLLNDTPAQPLGGTNTPTEPLGAKTL